MVVPSGDSPGVAQREVMALPSLIIERNGQSDGDIDGGEEQTGFSDLTGFTV
jgi:hypothetical protein